MLAGLEPQQLLFSWGWSVGGGTERNKQGFQMSSSPLKSHSLKHICVSRAVHNENRLSQLLFLVLCVGYLYGSFFPPFKSDPLVYKGSVQTELYPESCSQLPNLTNKKEITSYSRTEAGLFEHSSGTLKETPCSCACL